MRKRQRKKNRRGRIRKIRYDYYIREGETRTLADLFMLGYHMLWIDDGVTIETGSGGAMTGTNGGGEFLIIKQKGTKCKRLRFGS